jgi:hypothetical protein
MLPAVWLAGSSRRAAIPSSGALVARCGGELAARAVQELEPSGGLALARARVLAPLWFWPDEAGKPYLPLDAGTILHRSRVGALGWPIWSAGSRLFISFIARFFSDRFFGILLVFYGFSSDFCVFPLDFGFFFFPKK